MHPASTRARELGSKNEPKRGFMKIFPEYEVQSIDVSECPRDVNQPLSQLSLNQSTDFFISGTENVTAKG